MKKLPGLLFLLLLLVVLGAQVTATDTPAESTEPAAEAPEAVTPEVEADLDFDDEPLLFTPMPKPQTTCGCNDDDDCNSQCLDGGECMGGECACYTASPPCNTHPGGGGGGPGGSCGECTDNDDCLGCGPEYVCASWGECAAV